MREPLIESANLVNSQNQSISKSRVFSFGSFFSYTLHLYVYTCVSAMYMHFTCVCTSLADGRTVVD